MIERGVARLVAALDQRQRARERRLEGPRSEARSGERIHKRHDIPRVARYGRDPMDLRA